MSDALGEGLRTRERVPIKEAAERLGVSPDTIRRRLKAGELTGEREKTPQGFVWRVELPAEAASGETGADMPTAPTAAPGDAVELARLRERVSGLERLADELSGERDAWRDQATRDGEAARELRILLQHAQAFASALPATITPQDGPDGPDAHGEAPGGGETARRGDDAPSAWQRLRRRLGAG